MSKRQKRQKLLILLNKKGREVKKPTSFELKTASEIHLHPKHDKRLITE